MLQAITHNYHNHSDNAQNFRFKNLQETDTKIHTEFDTKQ